MLAPHPTVDSATAPAITRYLAFMSSSPSAKPAVVVHLTRSLCLYESVRAPSAAQNDRTDVLATSLSGMSDDTPVRGADRTESASVGVTRASEWRWAG